TAGRRIQDLHGIPAGGQDAAPIGAECHADHAMDALQSRRRWAATGCIPNARLPAVSRDEATPVRAEREELHRPTLLQWRSGKLTGFRIPDPRGGITTGGHDPPAIRAELHVANHH